MNREPLACHRVGPLRNGNPRGNPGLAPRCGAKNRAGAPCQAPALRGRVRCRLHGGASTGPRTEQGLARMRAARTVHGAYGAAAMARRRYVGMAARRGRVLAQAGSLRPWLPEGLRARLMAGAMELGPLPEPAWRVIRDKTACIVALARRETESLAPWRDAIAAARLARKQARDVGNDPMNREGGSGDEASSRGRPACAGHDGECVGDDPKNRDADASGSESGQRRGCRAFAHDGERESAGHDPMNREDGLRGEAASRGWPACAGHNGETAGNDPLNREDGPTRVPADCHREDRSDAAIPGRDARSRVSLRSARNGRWSRGWKGTLCAGTYLASPADYIAWLGGWLRVGQVERATQLVATWQDPMNREAGQPGWTLPDYGPTW
jgi:hypothetical protein